MHTILAEEFRETQDGTLHFRYLVDPEFGHVRVVTTLEEHARPARGSVGTAIPSG